MINRTFLTLCFLGGLTLFACVEAAPYSEANKTHAGVEVSDLSANPADPCSPRALVAEAMTSGTKIFAGVTLDTSTPIAEILGNMEAFAGKTIRIEGIIVEICSSQGCYVMLEDPEGNKLNLKVVDGELDFRELVKTGQYAVGEGVFTTEGEHGAQIDIMPAGAMVTSTVCAF
jgi:hypothetical protein